MILELQNFVYNANQTSLQVDIKYPKGVVKYWLWASNVVILTCQYMDPLPNNRLLEANAAARKKHCVVRPVSHSKGNLFHTIPSLNLTVRPTVNFVIAENVFSFSPYFWFKCVCRITKRGTLLRLLTVRLSAINSVPTNFMYDAYLWSLVWTSCLWRGEHCGAEWSAVVEGFTESKSLLLSLQEPEIDN
jgi:hypothetical protein